MQSAVEYHILKFPVHSFDDEGETIIQNIDIWPQFQVTRNWKIWYAAIMQMAVLYNPLKFQIYRFDNVDNEGAIAIHFSSIDQIPGSHDRKSKIEVWVIVRTNV